MKSTISFVSLVFGGFLIAGSTAFAHPKPSNPETTSPVTVYINSGADKQSFTLNVGPDGQLASTEIPPTDITIAQIDSTLPVKCFFSRHLESEKKSVEYDVISEVISPGGVHLPTYHSADRLFCYDSTNEADRDDTFKVFITTKDGTSSLVTLTLSEPTFAKIYMVPEYESLSKDVRGVAIVHHPHRTDPGWDKHNDVRCGLTYRSTSSTFGLRTGLKFSPTVDVEKVACSTDKFSGKITSIGKRSARS